MSNYQPYISVKIQMPDSGRNVLVYWKNTLGNIRIAKAFYAEAGKHEVIIDEWSCDELNVEYIDDQDRYCLKQGWYEVIENWDDYSSIVIDEEILGWLPLPLPQEKHE